MPNSGGSNGRVKNSRHDSSHSNEETVRFVNEEETEDSNVTFVD